MARRIVLDFLSEMRRIALLVLMRTLFSVDFAPDLPNLWEPVLKAVRYISPGLWMFWRNMPRPAIATHWTGSTITCTL